MYLFDFGNNTTVNLNNSKKKYSVNVYSYHLTRRSIITLFNLKF